MRQDNIMKLARLHYAARRQWWATRMVVAMKDREDLE
jgi:hypothetical protein